MTDLPADPIAAMFDADPQSLTDAQFQALIHEVRRRRSVFASEEAAKALAPKRARSRPEPSDAPPSPSTLDKPITEVNLDDLL